MIRNMTATAHAGGNQATEVLAMFTQIAQIIRASQGYVYESAGVLTGFFDDPNLARQCAELLKVRFGYSVELCGC